jgi:aspartate aminotransferase
MPHISQRAQNAPQSPIRRLGPFADAAKARGIDVIHLNIGQPDIDSPPEFWDAILRNHPRILEYSHSAGNESLRRKMRKTYERILGISLQEGDLMVTTAASEAVCFSMLACCNAEEEVIVPEPLYANYLGFAAVSTIRMVGVPGCIEDNFALPSAEEIAQYITPKTRAILICNPNNPSGAIYGRADLLALSKVCLQNDLFLISDEVYREFNYTNERPPSVLELPGLEQHAILIDSVSKRYSLCGARLGYLVTKNKDVMSAAMRFAMARLSPPGLAQIGVEGALEVPDSYFEEMCEEYRGRRDLLVSRLRAIPGVLCPQVDGAFYAMVRLPIDDSDRFCRWLLESFSHKNRTVMLAPGTGFYVTAGRGKDEVRIAYVLNKDRISEAMDCLEVALATYPGRKITASTAARS